jgi:vacuolar-type H+-ATPase subunit I/STV1
VLSLVFSAAVITFVNAQQNTYKANQIAISQLQAEKGRADKLAQDRDADNARLKDNYGLAMQQMEVMKQQANQTSQQVADMNAKLQDANTKLAMLQATVTSQGEALKASEDTKAKQWENIIAQRQQLDSAQTQAAQMNTQINDLTNKLEVTERERRFAAEQLEQLRQEATRLGGILKDHNIAIGPSEVPRTSPRINGVVTDVRTIAGRPYATISVGSVDSVVKGMQFNVVDRDSGNFLGILTVDTVEPNESTGQLQGPKIPDIRKGVEVKTQL